MLIENQTIKHISLNLESDALLIETYENNGRRLHLDSWEKGLVLHIEEEHFIRNDQTNLSLFTPEQAPRRQNMSDSLNLFTSRIPAEIMMFVYPISFAQLQTLQIFRHGGTDAVELFKKAPALMWLMACDVLYNRISLRHAVNLVKGRHIDIIKSIRADYTKKHLKLVNKIIPFHYCKKELRILNQILKDDNLLSNLRHLPRIVLPWVEIVLDAPDIQTIAYIQKELSDTNGSKYRLMLAKTMCESCLQIGKEAGLPNVKHILRNCQTLSELTALADRWHGRYNKKLQKQLATYSREKEAVEVLNLTIRAEEERQRQQRRERKRLEQEQRQKKRKEGFPKPPIPGNKFIVPITTSSELKHEGKVMNNCVETYEDKILFKNSYIYKVYYPGRCTLEVVGRQYCSIGELKAKSNFKPHKIVHQYVQEWINKHNSKSLSTEP